MNKLSSSQILKMDVKTNLSLTELTTELTTSYTVLSNLSCLICLILKKAFLFDDPMCSVIRWSLHVKSLRSPAQVVLQQHCVIGKTDMIAHISFYLISINCVLFVVTYLASKQVGRTKEFVFRLIVISTNTSAYLFGA